MFLPKPERLRNAGTGKKVLSPPGKKDIGELFEERASSTLSPPSTPTSPSSSALRSLVHVRVDLEMKGLWDEFFSLGTEMIVTKAGRLVGDLLLFPVLFSLVEALNME